MLSTVLKAQHAFIMTVDMCDRCDDKHFADINSFCKEGKADTVLFLFTNGPTKTGKRREIIFSLLFIGIY